MYQPQLQVHLTINNPSNGLINRGYYYSKGKPSNCYSHVLSINMFIINQFTIVGFDKCQMLLFDKCSKQSMNQNAI